MQIKSLFAYAEVLQDKAEREGKTFPCEKFLERAAGRLVDGYIDLNDVNEESNLRLDAWGFEILPEAKFDAVNYWLAKGFELETKITDLQLTIGF